MKKWIIAVLVAVGILVLLGFGISKWAVNKYNKLIAMGQDVDKSWSQVENVLQRRSDLIPNLVNVVQAYAVQEQQVFINVAEARSGWLKTAQDGTIQDKIKANNALSGTLFNLMAVSESYPELKSDQNFLALRDELAGTENRIAVERMRYNESVQQYNTFAKSFLNNLIVKFFDFKPEREFFEADEGAEKAPEVKFNFPGTAPSAPVATPPSTPPPLPSPPAQPRPEGGEAPAEPQAMTASQITPPTQPEAPAAQPPAQPEQAPAPASAVQPSINLPPPKTEQAPNLPEAKAPAVAAEPSVPEKTATSEPAATGTKAESKTPETEKKATEPKSPPPLKKDAPLPPVQY